jgi:hypothetical protein
MVRYHLRDIKVIKRKILFYLLRSKFNKLSAGAKISCYKKIINGLLSFPSKIKAQILLMSRSFLDSLSRTLSECEVKADNALCTIERFLKNCIKSRNLLITYFKQINLINTSHEGTSLFSIMKSV